MDRVHNLHVATSVVFHGGMTEPKINTEVSEGLVDQVTVQNGGDLALKSFFV